MNPLEAYLIANSIFEIYNNIQYFKSPNFSVFILNTNGETLGDFADTYGIRVADFIKRNYRNSDLFKNDSFDLIENEIHSLLTRLAKPYANSLDEPYVWIPFMTDYICFLGNQKGWMFVFLYNPENNKDYADKFQKYLDSLLTLSTENSYWIKSESLEDFKKSHSTYEEKLE